ncbi:hypothetical protein FSOLCH5_013453 [Fusarium solani]
MPPSNMSSNETLVISPSPRGQLSPYKRKQEKCKTTLTQLWGDQEWYPERVRSQHKHREIQPAVLEKLIAVTNLALRRGIEKEDLPTLWDEDGALSWAMAQQDSRLLTVDVCNKAMEYLKNHREADEAGNQAKSPTALHHPQAIEQESWSRLNQAIAAVRTRTCQQIQSQLNTVRRRRSVRLLLILSTLPTARRLQSETAWQKNGNKMRASRPKNFIHSYTAMLGLKTNRYFTCVKSRSPYITQKNSTCWTACGSKLTLARCRRSCRISPNRKESIIFRCITGTLSIGRSVSWWSWRAACTAPSTTP